MKNIITYMQAENYILSIPKFTKKNTWEQTRAFYEFLGKPGAKSKIIHVAGTNGKGSVCAYIDSCLRAGGYTVGMFTSPHLTTMRERIRLNGEWISEKEFLEIFWRLGRLLESYLSQKAEEKRVCTEEGMVPEEAYHPTFFEWLFFMNMLYMEERQPQIILLETGLGGRLDATNVIDPPVVCVITPVGLDHQEYLGTTYAEIAEEKAGIIKKGSRVVYAAMRPESEGIIEQKAEEAGCFCRRVLKEEETGFDLRHKRIDFSYYSRYYGYIPLSLSTTAFYQVGNARLALTALEEAELPISARALEEGIRACLWEGRMEEILPGVFLDGAHNREGIEAFLETVKRDGCRGKRWLLFSAAGDKEVQVMAGRIKDSGLFQVIYAAQLDNERGLPAERLRLLFGELKVIVGENIPDTLDRILQLRKAEDMVYVAGSLYMVGEVKAAYGSRKERHEERINPFLWDLH